MSVIEDQELQVGNLPRYECPCCGSGSGSYLKEGHKSLGTAKLVVQTNIAAARKKESTRFDRNHHAFFQHPCAALVVIE
jgi:hypothetical protein